MYRTHEDILKAMIDKETSPHNATRYIYSYKKKGEYDIAAMWFRAKIEYEEEYGKENKKY